MRRVFIGARKRHTPADHLRLNTEAAGGGGWDYMNNAAVTCCVLQSMLGRQNNGDNKT